MNVLKSFFFADSTRCLDQKSQIPFLHSKNYFHYFFFSKLANKTWLLLLSTSSLTLIKKPGKIIKWFFPQMFVFWKKKQLTQFFLSQYSQVTRNGKYVHNNNFWIRRMLLRFTGWFLLTVIVLSVPTDVLTFI